MRNHVLPILALAFALEACASTSTREEKHVDAVVVQLALDGRDSLLNDTECAIRLRLRNGLVVNHHFSFRDDLAITSATMQIANAFRDDGFDVMEVPEVGAVSIRSDQGICGFEASGFALALDKSSAELLRKLGYGQ